MMQTKSVTKSQKSTAINETANIYNQSELALRGDI
jgi:hypothetical protein